MKREILFKAKRVDNLKWVEGYYTHLNKKFNPCIHVGIVEVYEIIPETLGQYTGVTDMNGKKIFEGDISKVDTIHPSKDVVCKWNHSQYRWSWYLIESNNIYCHLGEGSGEPEITGNIHD